MQNFFNWIITSSADPMKISLALRGFLVGLIPVLMTMAAASCSLFAGLCVDSSLISPFIEGLVNVVKTALELVAGGMFLWGIIRKIVLGRWSHPNAV